MPTVPTTTLGLLPVPAAEAKARAAAAKAKPAEAVAEEPELPEWPPGPRLQLRRRSSVPAVHG